MKKQIYNTLPNKKAEYWQFSLLPEIAILKHTNDKFLIIVITWMFWNVDFIINCSK